MKIRFVHVNDEVAPSSVSLGCDSVARLAISTTDAELVLPVARGCVGDLDRYASWLFVRGRLACQPRHGGPRRHLMVQARLLQYILLVGLSPCRPHLRVGPSLTRIV